MNTPIDNPKLKFVLFIGLFLIDILLLLGLSSCRSHKESALSESSYTEEAATAQVNEKLTSTTDNLATKQLSFDSIEIFIQRTWGIPYDQTVVRRPPEKSLSDGLLSSDTLYEVNFAKNMQPYSEIVGIKAFNAKASDSFHSQDSTSASKDSSLAIDISMESQKEESDTSDSISISDPPDLTVVVAWTFAIAAIILAIVYFIKRNSNP